MKQRLSEPCQRFADYLPDKPYCSEDLKSGLIILNKKYAMSKPYIQLAQHRKAYMAFDIDYEGAAFAYEDAHLPAPTITVINPINAYAHFLYELTTPVLFPLSNSMVSHTSLKAQRYFNNIREAYTEQLKADHRFAGLIVKNPLHPQWRLLHHGYSFGLDKLADYVDLSVPRRKRAVLSAELGRNCTLFDECRFYAYKNVKDYGNADVFYSIIYRFCENYNRTFGEPLPESEIRSVSKSVSKWVWKNRENFSGEAERKNRGVMGFKPLPIITNPVEKEAEIRKRQKQGAEYTHQKRKEETEQAIFQVIRELRAKKEKITKAKVAKLANVSRRILYHYQYLFETEESLKKRFYKERVTQNSYLLRRFREDGWESPLVHGNYNSFLSKIFPSKEAREMVLAKNIKNE